MRKVKHVQSLLANCNILLVQETWALRDQVGKLNQYFDEYNTYGVSSINANELLSGRPYGEVSFLVVFSFFEKTTYCCRARRLSVCPSVRLSVRPSVCPSVRPSVVCGNNLFSR